MSRWIVYSERLKIQKDLPASQIPGPEDIHPSDLAYKVEEIRASTDLLSHPDMTSQHLYGEGTLL